MLPAQSVHASLMYISDLRNRKVDTAARERTAVAPNMKFSCMCQAELFSLQNKVPEFMKPFERNESFGTSRNAVLRWPAVWRRGFSPNEE